MNESPVAANSDLGDGDGKPGPHAYLGERPGLAWLLPWILAAAGILLTVLLSR